MGANFYNFLITDNSVSALISVSLNSSWTLLLAVMPPPTYKFTTLWFTSAHLKLT